MVLTALRGGLGFLSRVPVGRDETAWNAFRQTPVAFVLVGYILGGILVLPLFAPLPAATLAVGFVCWLYFVTGITHLDGLADLGDAVVVHGDRDRRRAVMQDTVLGVGGTLAISLAVIGLGFAGYMLGTLPFELLLIVVTAEVGAKLGMAVLACVGTAAHDGFGQAVTSNVTWKSASRPVVLAIPAGALTWPHPAAAVSLASAIVAATGVYWVALRTLGGINGDVLGASNEIARIVALHAGVIAWTAL